jgi:hypothetical protein
MITHNESAASSLAVTRLSGRPKITGNSSRSADRKACEDENVCIHCEICFVNKAALFFHIHTENHKVSAERVKEDAKAAGAAYIANRSPINTEGYIRAKKALARLKKQGKEVRRRVRHRRTR